MGLSVLRKDLQDLLYKQKMAREMLSLLQDNWDMFTPVLFIREGNLLRDLHGNVFILKSFVQNNILPNIDLKKFTNKCNELVSYSLSIDRILLKVDCLKRHPRQGMSELEEFCCCKDLEKLQLKALYANSVKDLDDKDLELILRYKKLDLSLYTITKLANLTLYQCEGAVIYGGVEFINTKVIDKSVY